MSARALVWVSGLALGCGKSVAVADSGPPREDAAVVAVMDAAAGAAAKRDEAADEAEKNRQAMLDFIAAKEDAGPCVRPLAELCAGKCPTFESVRARALKDPAAKVPCRIGGVTTGTCGAFTFVQTGGGYGGTTFYAMSGTLVGGRRSSDFNEFCSRTSSSVSYGTVPECTEVVTSKVCDRDAGRAACQPGDPLCVQ